MSTFSAQHLCYTHTHTHTAYTWQAALEKPQSDHHRYLSFLIFFFARLYYNFPFLFSVGYLNESLKETINLFFLAQQKASVIFFLGRLPGEAPQGDDQ